MRLRKLMALLLGVLLLLSVSVPVFSTALSTEPQNLIPNPGAEDGLTNWTSVNQPTTNLANVNSGAKSFYMAGLNVNRKLTTSSIDSSLIEATKTYRLSVYIKISVAQVSSAAKFKFGLSPFNASVTYSSFGASRCNTVIEVKNLTTTYQQFSLDVTGADVLSGCPGGFMSGVIADTAESGYNVFFDDFELKETEILSNLITNPGAENAKTGWEGVFNVTTTPSSVKEGSAAFYFAGLNTNRSMLQTLPISYVNPDKNYTFSFYVKINTALPDSTLNIKYGIGDASANLTYDAFGRTGCFGTLAVNQISTTYQQMSLDIKGSDILEGGPSALKIGFIASGATTGTVYVLLDVLELKEKVVIPPGDHTITNLTTDTKGTVTGNFEVPDGGSTTLAITPTSHCAIQDVLVDGISVGAVQSYAFENVTSNHTIKARFKVLSENLLNNPGAESVKTGWEGIFSTTAVTSSVKTGSNAFYLPGLNVNRCLQQSINKDLIDPSKEYRFSVYIKTNRILGDTEAELKYGVTSDNINPTYASFGLTGCYSTIKVDDIGTTYKKLTIIIKGVDLTTAATANLRIGVISNKQTATDFYVYLDDFELIENLPMIPIIIQSNFGGAVSGPSEVTIGGNATYTINTREKYSVADVLVDGSSVGAVNTYTFYNVTAPHTLKVVFAGLTNPYTKIDFETDYFLEQKTRMEIISGTGYDGKTTRMLHVKQGEYATATFLNWSTTTKNTDTVFSIPVKPNSVYKWSVRYKFAANQSNNYFGFYVDYNQPIIERVNYKTSKKDAWLQDTVYLKTGVDQTVLSTTFNAGASNADFWIDDIELTEIAPGVMNNTDLTYCESFYNVIDNNVVLKQAEKSNSFVLKLAVKPGVRYTFGATVSYSKNSTSYIALANDVNGTIMGASEVGAPSAVIKPTGATGQKLRSGYMFMTDSTGYVYLVVKNDDGALKYSDLCLFQTFSTGTDLPMGYKTDPNDYTDYLIKPVLAVGQTDANSMDSDGDGVPDTGEEGLMPYITILLLLSVGAVLLFRLRKGE